MKQNIKEAFLENLQNGAFRKGNGLMKYVTPRGILLHCALGVLAEMYEEHKNRAHGRFVEVPNDDIQAPVAGQEGIPISKLYSICGETVELPERILKWAGITREQAQEIVNLNDGVKSPSFAKVVAYVRDYL